MANIDFSCRLQGLLKETKTTRQQLATAIGVSHQSVTQWQSGQTIPEILKFKKIAEYFDVSYDYLLGDSKSKKNENVALVEDLGLSEKAIETLLEADELADVLSAFLENNDFMIFVAMVDDLLAIDSGGTVNERNDADYALYQAAKQIERVLMGMVECGE